MAQIISCRPIGNHQTYDLEVEHCDHQFYLANGVLTSNSHAYVYAYNSYQCAWLYTYFEKEWIKACLEKDPDLEKTIASVSSLGYEVSKPDINESLADEWQIIGSRCVPPLVAIKGLGDAAAQELISKRGNGFKTIEDFLFEKDENNLNKWRWSKFNKRAIQNMIHLEAFDSLMCVGEDCIFKNYAHMDKVIMNNFDKLKKAITREGRGKKAIKSNINLYELDGIEEIVAPWENHERIDKQQELLGTFDKSLLFTPSQTAFINKYDLKPYVTVTDDEVHAAWFFVNDIEEKTTTRGNPYLKLGISDGVGNHRYMNYFAPAPHSIKTKRLHIAKLYTENWFLNVEGKIHCIE